MTKKKAPIIPKTVAELKHAPYNPRTITHKAGTALEYSMQEFGDLSGIVFNCRTGRLVAGHQRRDRLPPSAEIVNVVAAEDDIGTVALGQIAVGDRRWPIRFVDWDELKEKAANLTANNAAISGDFTAGADDLLKEIQASMPDVYDQTLLGDIEAELQKANGEDEDDDAAGEYDLAPMLYESYNYVVVFFKNDIDWTRALEHFALKQVRDRGNPKNVGLGHVIDGAEYLKRVVK